MKTLRAVILAASLALALAVSLVTTVSAAPTQPARPVVACDHYANVPASIGSNTGDSFYMESFMVGLVNSDGTGMSTCNSFKPVGRAKLMEPSGEEAVTYYTQLWTTGGMQLTSATWNGDFIWSNDTGFWYQYGNASGIACGVTIHAWAALLEKAPLGYEESGSSDGESTGAYSGTYTRC